jgi:hypothetical protein
MAVKERTESGVEALELSSAFIVVRGEVCVAQRYNNDRDDWG